MNNNSTPNNTHRLRMNWPSSSAAWCRLLLHWSRSGCYRIRPPCGSGLRGHTGAARRGRTGSPVSSTPPQTRGGSSAVPDSCPFCNEPKVLSIRFRKKWFWCLNRLPKLFPIYICTCFENRANCDWI